MKRVCVIILTSLLWLNASAQKKDIWVAFWNKDHSLRGFKDQFGKIRIHPKFNDFTIATKFDHIIGVSLLKHGNRKSYYLTKKGRIIGRDSLYIFDNGADCESEGFIRFRDKITHKVGMFDINGDIAIPADYDNLMPVRNGMIQAYKNGHWDISQQSEHNQYPWTGSKLILISNENKVLISDFKYEDENINFFSLIVSTQRYKSDVRDEFKGVNGKYYSFINFSKEFKTWLNDSLLNNLTKTSLLKFSYKNIVFWGKQKGWINETSRSFINKNYKNIRSKLLALNITKSDYHVFVEGLNSYNYSSKEFEKYFNDCNEPMSWRYPVMNLVISYNRDKDLVQDQFNFLRTGNGYKLIEVSIAKQ